MKESDLELDSFDSTEKKEELVTFVELANANIPSSTKEFVKPPFAMFPDDPNSLVVCSKWDHNIRIVDKDRYIWIIFF